MTDAFRSGVFGGSTKRSWAFDIVLLVVIWIALAAAVNPVGNFPLNDDWAFGKVVQRLFATGHFALHDWGPMNLIVQIYWGALFCLPFGFSFTALRFSTLALGLIGILAVYALLREFYPRRPIPVLGALLIALNPIYLGLSNTFMTDVPFFAFFISSIWAFSRGLRRDSRGFILAGIGAAGLALLVRQYGLILFISFGGAYILKKRAGLKTVSVGISIALTGAAVQFSYQHWLRAANRAPGQYGNLVWEVEKIITGNLGEALLLALQRILEFTIYAGIFLFPALVWLFFSSFPAWPAKRKRGCILFLAAFVLITIAAFAVFDRWMPFTTNVLSELGLGPLTLRDAVFGPTEFARPPALKGIWIALTAIGVGGAGILFELLFLAGMTILRKRKAVTPPEKWPAALVLMAIVLYFLCLMPQPFFDRYLLPFWPLFLTLAAVTAGEGGSLMRMSRSWLAVSLLFLLFFGTFAIGATHDYLAWNRTRWEASRTAKDAYGITPKEMDGGFEYNGWYSYRRGYQSRPGRSWWWVDGDQYSIVFGPIPGYDEMKTYRLKRWLPFGPETILIVRKGAPSPGRAP